MRSFNCIVLSGLCAAVAVEHRYTSLSCHSSRLTLSNFACTSKVLLLLREKCRYFITSSLGRNSWEGTIKKNKNKTKHRIFKKKEREKTSGSSLQQISVLLLDRQRSQKRMDNSLGTHCLMMQSRTPLVVFPFFRRGVCVGAFQNNICLWLHFSKMTFMLTRPSHKYLMMEQKKNHKSGSRMQRVCFFPLFNIYM